MPGLYLPDGRTVPPGAVNRLRVRAALGNDGLGAAFPYDAAAPVSQEISNWLPWVRSPDSEINWDRDRLVARARDLVRNDGWAAGAINRILDAAIGAHFFPIPRPNFRALARRLDPRFDATWAREFASIVISEWRLYADDIERQADATGRFTVTQLLRLALRAKLVEGDALGLVLWQPDRVENGQARYATTLQLIDPDRLSNPQEMIDTADRRGGVQIDPLGAPLGYHIRRAHQFDWYDSVESITWDYFPRATPWGRAVTIHDFEPERAGQHRGTGILTTVINQFRMQNRYDVASLQAALARAVIAYFIKSSQPDSVMAGVMGDGSDPVTQLSSFYETYTAATGEFGSPYRVNGVTVPRLLPNDELGAVANHGHADDYTAYQNASLRKASSATGQASEEISNDFSRLNYSSYRGARAQAWKTLIRRRTDFAAGFASPFYTAWLEECVDTHAADLLPRGVDPECFVELRQAFAAARWIGPGQGWIDPVKERQGEVLGLDAGFGTLEDTCADIEGEWWEDRLDQRAIEVAAFDERGLKLPEVYAGANAQQSDQRPQPA